MATRSLLVTTLLLLGACTTRDPGTGTDTDSGTDPTSEASSSGSSSGEPTGTGSSDGSSSSEPTGTGSTDGSSSEPTGTGSTTADVPYKRECEPGDFVCDDWGCQEATESGECYKPCTPSGEIGGTDSECDEPERPFCSQVGLAEGGDFDCNGCKHICMAEPLNWCDHAADQCE